MKYIEKYGTDIDKAREFFIDIEDIACEKCNTTCTWEDVNIDAEGHYLCDDCIAVRYICLSGEYVGEQGEYEIGEKIEGVGVVQDIRVEVC